MKPHVAIVGCDSYDYPRVRRAVNIGMELLGGVEAFVQPDDKILLKPNVLAGDKPEKSVTVHPQVFRAVIDYFSRSHNNISCGDSPGFGHLKQQLKKAGLAKVAEDMNVNLADFEHGREYRFPNSPFTKKFTLADAIDRHDALISISKLKTHQLTRLTGAVKNQFGCIPGLLKMEYHVTTPDPHDFAKMLVSLTLALKPRLYIMDAIRAMQGNGPRGGETTPMNVLLFSTDPIALDAVAARLVDLKPEYMPTALPGQEWGLGTFQKEKITLLGDSIERFINPHFDVVRKPVSSVVGASGISMFKNWVAPRPKIRLELCIACGICVESCPVNPKALSQPDPDKPPIYTYSRCIRCYCCQELCPHKAIQVSVPRLGRLLGH